MNARNGVLKFLTLPAVQGRLTAEDIEKTIHIASEKSPSSAIKMGQAEFTLAHPGTDQMAALDYGKGCRWLAMIRRDEGEEAFKQKSDELRQLINSKPKV